jgi:hypothetical protein
MCVGVCVIHLQVIFADLVYVVVFSNVLKCFPFLCCYDVDSICYGSIFMSCV